MKALEVWLNLRTGARVRPAAKSWLAAVLFVLIGLSPGQSPCRAQTPGADVPGAEVLTRGPVHEAFAGMVTFNPEPGIVVTKAPPAVIEEMPPDARPEGDNVTWIPGYWAWDDERNDFLWVSGTWRALPPGRAWIAGYWGQVPQGYQWTSGYWADATASETTYLPAPPATVETGPNVEAPSADYGWTPGCWLWYDGRYAWSPGYWAQGRADWDWVPAHYVWTHRGYIFVGGFWDYPIERRGVLFAPVYFESGAYSRRGFYSPTIVISLGVFSDCLFLRPRYNHYYFGDYYAPGYSAGGFHTSVSFQSGHYGYDPIFSHQRWEHRQDREWTQHVEASYQDRRDHASARPPRTWAAQNNINRGPASQPNREVMATPLDQLAKSKGNPMKFQPVAKAEQQALVQRGQAVQQARDQRRVLEARAGNTSGQKSGTAFAPVTVKLPQSPIVAKSASQLGENQSPPKRQQLSKPDPKFQPKPESPATSPAPKQSSVTPRERQVQPELQPRSQEPGAKVQRESPPDAREMSPPAVRASEAPVKPKPATIEKGATKLVRHDSQNAVSEKRPASKDAPVTPPAGGNPAANERNQSSQPDKGPPDKGSH